MEGILLHDVNLCHRKRYWDMEVDYKKRNPVETKSLKKRKRQPSSDSQDLKAQKMENIPSSSPKETPQKRVYSRKSDQWSGHQEMTPQLKQSPNQASGSGSNVNKFPSNSEKKVVAPKARTPYFFFTERIRMQVAREMNTGERTNVTRNETRRRWNLLTKAEKHEFIKLSKDDSRRIEEERKAEINTNKLLTMEENDKKDIMEFIDCTKEDVRELNLSDLEDFTNLSTSKETRSEEETVNISLEEIMALALSTHITVGEAAEPSEEQITTSERGIFEEHLSTPEREVLEEHLSTPEKEILALARGCMEPVDRPGKEATVVCLF